ncbi:MAG: hypothetical protein JEZ06_15035 [Anaerolineaceae bacterium]|nr:hypothetical protein [Anaerolineaceae bacterium]
MSRENLKKKWSRPSAELSNNWAPEGKKTDTVPLAPHKTMKVKSRRKRNWEKNHPPFTYRRFPQALRDRIKYEAHSHRINSGEFFRALLEYGINALENGTLNIEPKTSINRKLFSNDDGWTLANNYKWGLSVERFENNDCNEDDHEEENLASRRSTASYRIPPEMHHYMKQAAQQRNLDLGVFVVKLISFSIEKYDQGVLPFKAIFNPESMYIEKNP